MRLSDTDCLKPTIGNSNVFGLFRHSCPVDARQQAWIEIRLAWLCVELGLEQMLRSQVVLPDDSMFASFDGTVKSARELCRAICLRMGIEPNRVALEFLPEQEMRFLGVYEAAESEPIVRVAESLLSDYESLVATLVHELSHHVLLGDKHLTTENEDHEYVTDLLSVYLGFGIYSANSTIRETIAPPAAVVGGWSIGKQGYLTAREYGYALAVYAFIRKEAAPDWRQHLRLDARSSMADGMKYLTKTKDCLFYKVYEQGRRSRSDLEVVEDLKGRSAATRVAGLWHARSIPSPSEVLVHTVMNCLGDKVPVIRAEAATTLGCFGAAAEVATDVLIARLRDDQAEVRGCAALALAKVQADANVLNRLAELLDEEDTKVVAQALFAIGEFGSESTYLSEKVLARLFDTLVKCDFQLSEVAVWTLSQIVPDPTTLLRERFERHEVLRHVALDMLEKQRKVAPVDKEAVQQKGAE